MTRRPTFRQVVEIVGDQCTPTDRSGTITSGGAAQTLCSANANRSGLMVQNNSSGDLWISELTTAVAAQPSIKIGAGMQIVYGVGEVPTGAISIIGATTAQAFTAREW